MRENKRNNRYYEIIAGTMYLICMITSIGGGLLLEKILGKENLLQSLENNFSTLVIATILELINALGVLAIVISFYMLLRRMKPAMSKGYLFFKSLEGILCIGVSLLPILAFLYTNNLNQSVNQQNELLVYLLSYRTIFWAYVYPIVFISGGILLYSMLYMTRFLPRYIAIWGLLSLIGVFFAMFVPEIKMVPGIFIITNEIYLGFYLLFKKRSANAILT